MTSDIRSSKTKRCDWDQRSKSKFFTRLEDDNLVLNRNYFPGVDLNSFDENAKAIINEIEEDFRVAYKELLNYQAKFGVYTAFVYYKNCLKARKHLVRK
jgi:hypothetical protein